MGNCLNGSKKHDSNISGGGKPHQNQQNNQTSSKNQIESDNNNHKKAPQYTFDKYGKKVPVLSEVKQSQLMIRRNNSKEQIEP